MAKEFCADCEKVFEGGKDAFLCPACRKRRLSEAAKKRALHKKGTEARKKDK